MRIRNVFHHIRHGFAVPPSPQGEGFFSADLYGRSAGAQGAPLQFPAYFVRGSCAQMPALKLLLILILLLILYLYLFLYLILFLILVLTDC